jgi:diaminohydroxyphosphoribosylaminopyrimidine deaminase/5-amino-6-(5-phosphoribosylamino)uracil reductase
MYFFTIQQRKIGKNIVCDILLDPVDSAFFLQFYPYIFVNDTDQYMKRCLLLAEKGLGSVAPNPMVGCVIVCDDKIIGEGYHEQYGGPHAEVNAINTVADKSLLAKSTLYVNLEPCSHQGKTPPCSDLIVRYNIKKVVIGCLDTNILVAGKGIEKLKGAGIEVVTDVLKDRCRELNKRFFTFHEKKRPYIILKWAQTKDGFIAKKPPFTREENWITNDESNQLSHTWRGQEAAILVGTTTALLDNPQLTARLSKGKNPIRVLIDKDLKVPASNNIFSEKADVIVFTDKDISNQANVSYCKIDFKADVLKQILDELYHKGINSVIIEGGTNTLQQFIDRNLWDEARIFTGDKHFKEGLKSPILNGKKFSETQLGTDKLTVILR